MKKNILSIFLILSGLTTYAQQVPNGGFEQWFFNTNTMSYEPTGWSTSNLGIYGDTGVYKHTSARTGNYACGLQTHFVLSTFTVPGMLSTTFPISSKPDAMELYFKGNIAANDTSIIMVEFGQDTNIIADGSLFITQSQGSYTKFTIPIDFFGMGNPDSCTITILSGGFEIDDTLTSIAIDDISFHYPVNINSVYYGATDYISLYPNPASDQLNIQCELPYHSVMIYNTSGQLVTLDVNTNSIDVSTFTSGLYFLQLTDDKGQIVAKRSFIKD